jgi:hypothetical protein
MLVSIVLSLSIAFAAAAVDPNRQPLPTPLMRTVEPYTAKVGDEITVKGDNLGKNLVAEVTLTAGKAAYKVDLTAQSDTEIKFNVPAAVKPGAYRITVLLNSPDPTLIEEPVKLVITE